MKVIVIVLYQFRVDDNSHAFMYGGGDFHGKRLIENIDLPSLASNTNVLANGVHSYLIFNLRRKFTHIDTIDDFS